MSFDEGLRVKSNNTFMGPSFVSGSFASQINRIKARTKARRLRGTLERGDMGLNTLWTLASSLTTCALQIFRLGPDAVPVRSETGIILGTHCSGMTNFSREKMFVLSRHYIFPVTQ